VAAIRLPVQSTDRLMAAAGFDRFFNFAGRKDCLQTGPANSINGLFPSWFNKFRTASIDVSGRASRTSGVITTFDTGETGT
jgi:hypothetical protein